MDGTLHVTITNDYNDYKMSLILLFKLVGLSIIGPTYSHFVYTVYVNVNLNRQVQVRFCDDHWHQRFSLGPMFWQLLLFVGEYVKVRGQKCAEHSCLPAATERTEASFARAS